MSDETQLTDQIAKTDTSASATHEVIRRPVGRPSDYSPELAQRICFLLSMGMSLRSVCLLDDMPNGETIFRWLRTNKEFSEQYALAKQESTDAQQEQLESLGDEAIALSQTVDVKASGAVVQAVKLKADNLKWLMSKMKPKKYGDKLDLTSDGKALPTPIYGGASITPPTQ